MKVLERRNDGDPRVVELTAEESVLTVMYRSLCDIGFSVEEAGDMTITVAVESNVTLTTEFVQWMTDESRTVVLGFMAQYEEMVANA
jgi:hypothetical protein